MKLHTVDLDPSPEVSAASRSATRGGSAGESLYSEEAWSENMPSELKVQAGSLRGEVEVCHVSQSQCDGCFPSCISTCNISKRDVAGVSVCFLDLDRRSCFYIRHCTRIRQDRSQTIESKAEWYW